MPPPRPLTATEPPDLDLSRPDAPESRRFGDIYHSADGGLAESREVFLRGNGLPDRWTGRDRFVIGETGFGTGLNILLAWHLWRESGHPGRLHAVSIERYPLDADQLRSALLRFPELEYEARQLLAAWPGRVRGVHRLEFDRFTLDLHFRDIASALANMKAEVDAWFLDGFSPSKNPEMWSEANLARVGDLSAPDATLATFTVAGHVRRGLQAAGFAVERVPGFGRKRHRLEARRGGGKAKPARMSTRPVVVGGGIAGASVARAFLREGVVPTVIRSPDHARTAASANPLAMVKPRLDKQDRPESQFFLQSYLFAVRAYPEACVTHRGIQQIMRTEAERNRFAAIVEQGALPSDQMRLEGDRAVFPGALVIDPVAACEAFLEGADVVEAHVDAVNRTEGKWSLVADGEPVAEGTHLVVASGLDAKTRFPDLELRASRGQLTWAETGVDTPLAYGGYALPSGSRTLLGATHERVEGNPYRLEADDDVKNAAKLDEATGRVARGLSPARASVRVTTANTLPLVLDRGDGLHVLTGLGSRGFTHAPLLGAEVASRVLGLPRPLAVDQAETFSR